MLSGARVQAAHQLVGDLVEYGLMVTGFQVLGDAVELRLFRQVQVKPWRPPW